MTMIYKILPASLWAAAQDEGALRGSAVDVTDGYIHFSTAGQAAETAARHFAGQRDLVLLQVDSDTLGPALKWEPSRGGALFPHLYAPLKIAHVIRADPLPLGADNRHIFPLLT